MKLKDVLLTTLNDTPAMVQHNIKKDYRSLREKILDAEQAEQNAKNKKEKFFLKVYMNVFDQIHEQLRVAKERYSNLDKQKMKEERCFELAKDIKVFREECYFLQQRLKETRKMLLEEKLREAVLFCQNKSFHKSIEKKNISKTSQKMQTIELKNFLEEHEIQPMQKKFKRNSADITLRLSEIRSKSVESRGQRTLTSKTMRKYSRQISSRYKSMKNTHKTLSIV